MPLTYFEVATVLAFLVMAEEGVELAVLETGLGGRLDAVTTCEPLATAITSIGWDHMDYLGATLAAIAREKAGIIKPGVPLLHRRRCRPRPTTRSSASRARSARRCCRLGRDFAAPRRPRRRWRARTSGRTPRSPSRWRARRRGGSGARCPAEAIARGLARRALAGAARDGGDRGRARCSSTAPTTPRGPTALASALPPLLRGRRATLVISVVAGKDLAGVLRPLLPLFSQVIATRSRNPRALAPAELAAAIRAHAPLGAPPAVTVVEDAREAILEAQRLAGGGAEAAGSVVVVAGSIFLAAEVRAALLDERGDPQVVSDPL